MPEEQLALANPWFRQTPVWGAGVQVGPGPGLQGPDYSIPRPRNPGESGELLPSWPGADADQARYARHRMRAGKGFPGDSRPDPYLTLWQPLTYSATATANIISLGKPSSGWRWIVRQIMVLPGDLITSGGGAGLTAHMYIGNLPPVGYFPALTDWKWALTTAASAQPPQTMTWTSNIMQVQSNQNLMFFVSGSTGGYTSLLGAVVLHVPDVGSPIVESL